MIVLRLLKYLVIVLLSIGCSSRLTSHEKNIDNLVESCDFGIAGLVKPANSPAKLEMVDLGRRLFSDPRLSANQRISCATCHRPETAFTDGLDRSIGVQGNMTPRNSPTLYNVAYMPQLLWDGSASSLEQQVVLALTNPEEMGLTEPIIKRNLTEEYAEFESIFGEPPDLENISIAIAAFERTLLAGNTAVDRYLYCNDTEALAPKERQGLELFSGPANCIRCHWYAHESVHPFGGKLALFTDNRFHNIGAGASEDSGRAAVTGRPEDWGAFKTPSLRNVELTAPYMHDGSLSSLREVVEFYNNGGGKNPKLDPSIRPLRLSEDEIDALVEFLLALTSPEVETSAKALKNH